MSITGDLRALGQAGVDVARAKMRPLTAAEITEARSVFQDTIKYENVVIADKFGFGGRPFTLYTGTRFYRLFMGPDVFASMPAGQWPTFIHELTHVWQGQNHLISSGYMLNSMISQAIDGDTAYDYELGQMWGEYNVEQQAHLVEDWYERDGRSIAGPRYPYVRDDIRHPWRGWASDIWSLAAGAAQSRG